MNNDIVSRVLVNKYKILSSIGIYMLILLEAILLYLLLGLSNI